MRGDKLETEGDNTEEETQHSFVRLCQQHVVLVAWGYDSQMKRTDRLCGRKTREWATQRQQLSYMIRTCSLIMAPKGMVPPENKRIHTAIFIAGFN